ncbi:hypothetical protein TVAG_390130 [Trichomonas vaginalis G3]|uniref:Uncharacterized protein n=1 Tax=Trichomonas vaginalis (strain ATCC PRA-98 / G3) TaxID=412133 RepID=A2E1B5_TRIV3|nr:hypothetical protein TVAGG3_0990620 [Trichomonas vaginalis G3]EAY13616.1 hypothetical protein TVAG_390130 [Trichomonas vaginalis G3]KAI5490004.1 hypothetical protein TVAGG3_0990620 [Trichomonas vaginalis G3]|eukprot:XP_001325839.1 hypothetical protein [Trichomonas vaginalis G3]
MTPRRLSNASGISAAPSNLSARSSIRRRMSNDEEQKSEIKQKIADICSIVEGSPAASYSYVPMDMLMKQLKHSITNKMESLKSLRNFAADTCVLINSPEKVSKEEILKKSNDEIFEFIFKGIELIKATKTDLQKETIKEICRNVGPDDVDFMSIPDMVNLTKTQMNLIKTTSNCTQNITKILKEIDTEITSNKSFSPSNELYSRYIKKIELMMKEFSQIPADSILPCVLPYLTESMSLINNITKSLTAASFAPTYQPNHEIIRKMVDDQQELSLKCEKLEKELEEMKNEANVAKNKLTDVMNAANLAANHKIEMIKKANANEIAQALSDYREVESLSDE